MKCFTSFFLFCFLFLCLCRLVFGEPFRPLLLKFHERHIKCLKHKNVETRMKHLPSMHNYIYVQSLQIKSL
jgi:hypothetical protein